MECINCIHKVVKSQHIHFQNFFTLPKRNSTYIKYKFSIHLPPQPLLTLLPLSASMNVPVLNIFLKWNHTIFVLSCLTFFLINMFFIHSVMSNSAIPWTAGCQDSLSFTISHILFKIIYTELERPSNHPIICHPFLLLPSIFTRIRIIFQCS